MSTSVREQVQRLLAGPRPLPLVLAGDPVLRAGTAEYQGELPDDLLAELIAAMRVAMQTAPGVGLAAPQIGLPLRIAVLEDPASVAADIATARDRFPLPFRVLINPHYEPAGSPLDAASFYEGCLSVPGYQAVVARATTIRLTSQGLDGRITQESVTGWPARIVAHETDHLDGRLYLDRAELRSLTTAEHYLGRWSGPGIEPARAALGF